MTYEEMIALSRRYASEGRVDDARRIAQAAVASREASPAPAPERSTWDKVVDNVVGRDDGVESYGEILGQMLNLGGESMTMGVVGDEADAGLRAAFTDATYDEALAEERGQEAAFREAHPGLALGAEIGGAMALPGAGLMGGGSMLARVGKSALAGGLGGATYGFMEGEGGAAERIDNGLDMGAFGAGVGAAVPVVGAGIQRGANSVMGNRAIRQAAAAAPDDAGLRRQAGEIFERAETHQLPMDDFRSSMGPTLVQAGRDGMDRELTPRSARVAARIQEEMAVPEAGIPWREVDTLRRQSSLAARSKEPGESSLGMMLGEGLDDYVDGVAPALGDDVAEARQMWGIMRRSERLQEAVARAQNTASGVENGLRIEFRKILNNPRQLAGFSPAEVAAMERVVRGTVTNRALRLLGSFGVSMDQGRNALGAAIGATAGTTLGGPIGGMLALGAATGARALSDRSTRNAAEIAQALTRTGGDVAMPQLTDQTRAIIEALMRRGSRPVLPGGSYMQSPL